MTVLVPKFPNIEILGRIGEGGTSSIWKARDLANDRIVALKILNREFMSNGADIDQFIAEENVMEKIDHPGIVKSYEIKFYGGVWYYLMEYVDGYNFATLLTRKQHLSESDCLLICESVAAALDYAWNEHGIVHCDIKPENLMINSEGVVKLTDLGLCHTFEYREGVQDAPDHVMGTPAYISPEQVYGDLEPDCRADIYSLAATLYHLSTGRVLFPNLSSEDMMRAHCDENTFAQDPRAYRKELSAGFCQMLEAMLVKNRVGRIDTWQGVTEMCQMIEQGYAFKPRDTPGNASFSLGWGVY